MPFNTAIRLLARREHGEAELLDKLIKKGYALADAREALAECQRLDLQSDARYASSFCRLRMRQGYGPLRIRQELQQKKLDSDLIEQVLAEVKEHWFPHALEVWHKKGASPLDFIEQQKRQRFLLYRGFPADIIALVIRELKSEFNKVIDDEKC